jgi:hypothetical protein
MIPTVTRYAPNSPQTPARQTAPAAQRPAAQRQGESKLRVFKGFEGEVIELNTLIKQIKEVQRQRKEYRVLFDHFWGMYTRQESLTEWLNTPNGDVDPVLQQAMTALKKLDSEQLQSENILHLIINDLIALQKGVADIIRRIPQIPPIT